MGMEAGALSIRGRQMPAWSGAHGPGDSSTAAGFSAQASAAAHVSHPAKQGLAQAFSAYVDTLFVCTMTGLMILATNSFNVLGPDEESLLTENVPGVEEGAAVLI
jgi:AGCS family alanine or glycine:cation symporter